MARTAEFAYNNKAHAGTKVSPFEANSGQNPRMGFELRKKEKFEGTERFAKRMKEVQEEAKAALGKAQEDMRRYADRHRERQWDTKLEIWCCSALRISNGKWWDGVQKNWLNGL